MKHLTPHRTVWLLLVLICAFNLGCGNRDDIGPPNIHLGSDVCAFCQMIISEQNFAAACIIRTPEGRRHAAAFDDIGCLLAFQTEESANTIENRYAVDFDSGAWLNADEAYYIQSAEIRSPMASGLIASGSRQSADALAERFGVTVQTLDQLASPTTHENPE